MGSVKYLCKLIGAGLVILGTVGEGLCLIRERRGGLFYAEKTVRMLKSIQHLVVYEKRTFAEACEYLSKDEDTPFKECFCRILTRMGTHEDEPFCRIWEEEFGREAQVIPFAKEETERLVRVPLVMTAAEPSRTAQMMDDTITFFEERVKKRKEQTGEREKVVLSVCVMAGALIGILFW